MHGGALVGALMGWETHPGFINVWFIPMAAKTCFNWPVWAKKAKSIYWDCWPVTLSHLFQVPSQRLEREIQTQFFSITKIDHQTKNNWKFVVNCQSTFKPPTYNCDQTQFPIINDDAFRLRQRNEKKVCCGSKVSRPRISTETPTGGVNTSGKLLVTIWGRMRQKLTMCSWTTWSVSSLTSKKLNRGYNLGRSSWYTWTTTWRHQRPLGLNLHLCSQALIRELSLSGN